MKTDRARSQSATHWALDNLVRTGADVVVIECGSMIPPQIDNPPRNNGESPQQPDAIDPGSAKDPPEPRAPRRAGPHRGGLHDHLHGPRGDLQCGAGDSAGTGFFPGDDGLD